jgi:hypothetical protein
MPANPEFDARLAEPEVKAAWDFMAAFEPKDGVEYGELADYAKARYEDGRKLFDQLDTKAGTILTYLGAGAGLFTLGSLAAVSSAKVPVMLVGLAIPAMVCALVAVTLAALGRRPLDVFPLPAPVKMLPLAEHHKTDAKFKAVLIPHWQLHTALLRQTVIDKAWYVSGATGFLIASLGLLLLPLLASLCVAPGSPPIPPASP